jgi:transcriptional regulator with XRE-family HTH domain
VFADLVREHRRRLSLTQEDLAVRAGLGLRTIGKIENGRITTPRAATVRLLGTALDLAGGDLDHFLRAASTVGYRPPTGMAVPAQLPVDVYGFTGRDHEIAQLDALLRAADDQTTAAVVGVVSGTAGVGKTALAVHWAHLVRERFPDGQFYVDLRGFDSTGTAVHPSHVLRGFFDALNIPAERVPPDLDSRAALYRGLLDGKRMLVLLDNARDTGHVRPLLPATPGCLALVTSRNQLTGLITCVGAHPLTVDVLPPAAARDLLTARLGSDRTTAEPDAVNRIVTATAGLPLALAVVAARAGTRSHLPLAALATELTGARLDVLCDTDDPTTDVRAVFSWSYRPLSEAAARLFRLLGRHAVSDISAPAAARLAGRPLAGVQPVLAELTRGHLVEELIPGHYTLHDLLRAYAEEQARWLDTDDRRAARRGTVAPHPHNGAPLRPGQVY